MILPAGSTPLRCKVASITCTRVSRVRARQLHTASEVLARYMRYQLLAEQPLVCSGGCARLCYVSFHSMSGCWILCRTQPLPKTTHTATSLGCRALVQWLCKLKIGSEEQSNNMLGSFSYVDGSEGVFPIVGWRQKPFATVSPHSSYMEKIGPMARKSIFPMEHTKAHMYIYIYMYICIYIV